MRMHYLTPIVILALALSVQAGDIPSYAKDVQAYRKASTGKHKVTPADKAVMQEAAAALNAAMPSPGLKVGDKAPDFTLSGAHGQTVTLSEALQKGPVVLTFYRGGWCPYCNLELQSLHRASTAFAPYKAQVIAVSPQTIDRSETQLSEKKLGFPLLSDLNNAVMKAYKVHFEMSQELDAVYQKSFGLDVTAYNGPGRLDLPVPGTFVIAQDGIIKAAFADTNYKARMEPAAILETLKALK